MADTIFDQHKLTQIDLSKNQAIVPQTMSHSEIVNHQSYGAFVYKGYDPYLSAIGISMGWLSYDKVIVALNAFLNSGNAGSVAWNFDSVADIGDQIALLRHFERHNVPIQHLCPLGATFARADNIRYKVNSAGCTIPLPIWFVTKYAQYIGEEHYLIEQ